MPVIRPSSGKEFESINGSSILHSALRANIARHLQLYILSRDRPDYLREALRSALMQASADIEVIISDNSEGDDVVCMLAEEFPSVRCIRRFPPLDSFDHFQAVIDEADAEFVVMFHDDDVMLDDYVQTLRRHLEEDPTLAAVCCDATILYGSKQTQERFAPVGRGNLRLHSAYDLLREYFSLSPKGPLPFPGYMYRRAAITGLGLDPGHGGKYSDVSFLLKVLSRGQVLWLDKALIQYRIHGHNDSATEAVGQRLRLLRYVFASTGVGRRSQLVKQYRYRFWMNWWHSPARALYPWRRRVVRNFLIISTTTYAVTRMALWQRIFGKLGRIMRQNHGPQRTNPKC
jgi:GT2 family glycosyltransferase